MSAHHARVRKLTGLSLLTNDKPWKVSYMVDTRFPGVMSIVGTSYHPTHEEALAAAIAWTDGHAKEQRRRMGLVCPPRPAGYHPVA